MKRNPSKLIAFSVLLTACMIPSLSKGAIVITDTFSPPNQVGLTTTGGQLTPTSSTNDTKWTVTAGSVSTNGTGYTMSPAQVAGQLAFSNTVNSRVQLDLGTVLAPVTPNTAFSLQFDLRHNTVAVAGSTFVLTLGNYTTGTSFNITMNTGSTAYGNTGIAIGRPAGGGGNTYGNAGTGLLTSAAFQTLNVFWDPATGTILQQNGTTIATQGPPPAGFNKIDYIAMNNGSTPSLAWYVDNVTITAVPEPSTWILLGLGLFSILIVNRRKLRQ